MDYNLIFVSTKKEKVCFTLRLCVFALKMFTLKPSCMVIEKKEGRLTPALVDGYSLAYFCFSSIASSVWVAEVTIGVPGPKILAAPAA